MKAIISAVVVFFATLYLSMAVFLPKVLELPAGEKAGMYSNLWLLGTMIIGVTFSYLIFKFLEKSEKRKTRRLKIF